MVKCSVCEAITANYKCPKCYARYCSVACCKSHKDSGCQAQQININSATTDKHRTDERSHNTWNGPEETEDQISQEKLKKLDSSGELKTLLLNPHLRAMMENLVNSEKPMSVLETAMQEPIFVEFADQCLRVVENEQDK